VAKYSIGLDYGTNSVRALVVDTTTGEEVGTSVWNYRHGERGVVVDRKDPELARQDPRDYVEGIGRAVKGALRAAKSRKGFSAADVIGIGVDTTGSTPLPLDRRGEPLAFKAAFRGNPHAMAWLWKDHTSHAEAGEVTALAAARKPEYLAKCGGTYSSEWFWAKVLRCRRVAPKVFDAAHTWAEIADWIPGLLSGTTNPLNLKRCICAAGHKAMFNPAWGGYPDASMLSALDPALGRVRASLPDRAYSIAEPVGGLTKSWAKQLGLKAGIPVAAGAFDAHLGGVGSGIQPGVLVKIIGTSTCDMAVAPLSDTLPDIPGLCGIVPESILPGFHGLEAGQSAVGDIFNWFVERIRPGGAARGSHERLTREAARLRPGESGLLALDWLNGNRTVLVDQRLTGLVLGMTLHTTPAEIYRALVEATAFGARVIVERFEEYGVAIRRVVNCGGISAKNPMVMQIYADVLNRPLEISRSAQTCALGAAMAGAVVAGAKAGGHDGFASAATAMTGVLSTRFAPDPERARQYDRLHVLYRRLHDAFGTRDYAGDLFSVMKGLLVIRDEARGAS
jgi:L-ribulokinase